MASPSILAVSPRQAAELLSAAGQPVSAQQIAADLDHGAPQNPDGTLNLFYYAAWLAKQESGVRG